MNFLLVLRAAISPEAKALSSKIDVTLVNCLLAQCTCRKCDDLAHFSLSLFFLLVLFHRLFFVCISGSTKNRKNYSDRISLK